MGSTIYNGDILKGRKVITELDVTDLEAGMTHELFFRAGGENNTGQYYYVPVSVIRGVNTGKRALFVAGVHANEMNSYLTANLIKQQLDPEKMSGTVTIVHQFNIPGLINDVREYVPSGPVKVIDRAVSGAINFLKHFKILPGESFLSTRAIETNEWLEVYAERGGFIVPKTKLMAKVKKGDLLFIQYGSFGEIVAEYTSPADGIVAQVVQNPMAEAGTQLAAIVFFNPDKEMDDNLGAGSITIPPKFDKKK